MGTAVRRKVHKQKRFPAALRRRLTGRRGFASGASFLEAKGEFVKEAREGFAVGLGKAIKQFRFKPHVRDDGCTGRPQARLRQTDGKAPPIGRTRKPLDEAGLLEAR